MAIGGGRGTESAPSSPSSSPQLCIPEEEDLDSVPLLRPSFLTLCKGNHDTRWPREIIDYIDHRNMANRINCCLSGIEILAWPLPQSHPGEWQRCRLSLSASPLLHSCAHRHGSSCACVPASLHGRPPCRCSIASQGWSAICARYCLVSWVLENSENPSCAQAAGWQMSQGGWHHCCTLIVCLETKRKR